jgi:hypothetical protein
MMQMHTEKLVVSVRTCMYLASNTNRYELPVSGYKHVLSGERRALLSCLYLYACEHRFIQDKAGYIFAQEDTNMLVH